MNRKIVLSKAVYAIVLVFILQHVVAAQNKCPKVDELSVSDVTTESAKLAWVGSSEHVSFDVDVMHGGGTPNFKFSETTSAQVTVVSGLLPGKDYRFRIKSKCDKGSGGSSKWFDFTTEDEEEDSEGDEEDSEDEEEDSEVVEKCPELEVSEVSEISDTGAVLSWSGDPAYTSFKVDVMQAPQEAPYKWSTTTTDTSVILEDLEPGRKYRFRIKASCDKGKSNSKWTAFMTTGVDSTGHGRCPKASNLAVIDVTDTSVVLTWLGNPENREYQVDVHQKEHTPTFRLSETVDTTAIEVQGLVPGGNYKFRVKASCEKNSAGSSSWINFVTTGGDSTFNQCPKPRNLSVLEVTDSSALLSWIALDSVNSFDFTVKSFEKTTSFALDTTLMDTFYLLTGLESGGNYQFRVVANCSDTSSSGSSDWSKFRTLQDTSSSSAEVDTSTFPVTEVESAEALVTTFPNPVEQELNVVLPLEKLGSLSYVTLTDLAGRQVYNAKFREVPTNANLPIPVGEVAPGIYKLAIRSAGFSATKTIIIQSHR